MPQHNPHTTQAETPLIVPANRGLGWRISPLHISHPALLHPPCLTQELTHPASHRSSLLHTMTPPADAQPPPKAMPEKEEDQDDEEEE